MSPPRRWNDLSPQDQASLERLHRSPAGMAEDERMVALGYAEQGAAGPVLSRAGRTIMDERAAGSDPAAELTPKQRAPG